MKDNLTKLYDAVKLFAKEKGENYVSVRITRTADFHTDTYHDVYERYIHGYHWHSGVTITEVINGLKSQKVPMADTKVETDDIDLPF